MRLALPCLLLPACGFGDFDDYFDFDDYRVDDCVYEPTAELDGAWSLSGYGTRSGCDSEEMNTGDLDLASSGVIAVLQDGRDLELANPLDGFTLVGSVDGACVSFTTVESEDDIIYTWTGEALSNTITGTFAGTGPESCISEGEFTVIID